MSRISVACRCLSVMLVASMLLAACVQPVSELPEQSFRIEIDQSGLYRLEFEDLAAAGLQAAWVPSSSLRMEAAGEPVPLHVVAASNGRFGPGDWVEFHAQRLDGGTRYNHPFQVHNAYWLSFQLGTHPRMLRHGDGQASEDDVASAMRLHHLEQDEMMIRVSARDTIDDPDPELWYWAKMTHVDRQPVEIEFELPDHDLGSERSAQIELRFRALSQPPMHWELGGMTHHQVDPELNGVALEPLTWDGKQPISFVLDELPEGVLKEGTNRLLMRVPARTAPGQSGPMVDIVMFDYLRASYPALGTIEQPLHTLLLDGQGGTVSLRSESAVDLLVVDDQARRYQPRRVADGEGGWLHLVRPAANASQLHTTVRGGQRRPVAVVAARGLDLREGPQTDYLMITHHTLAESIEPLAEFHRQRDLSVQVIDVDDIYENFGNGIVHPQAIKDFIAHTVEHWPQPAPRFVLLVGDASWDIRNQDLAESRYADWTAANIRALLQEGQFPDRRLPRYSETPELGHRNLIPTWQFTSNEGHSAADNWFVALDQDEFHPQLAIGRFPVVEPEEVQGIVNKIIDYAVASEVGPWRRNALWITEDNNSLRRISDQLADRMDGQGFEATKVYAEEVGPDNAYHQSRLVNAFNEGQLLVHFIGHGGRHIWRTGPPDPRRNHDLFTLDHISQLENGGRLPMVLSMTCYSAPFDHPSVDSIGEKFLREPGRGAVAVLAASWRNSPTMQFSDRIVENLMNPELTIGEAIMLAKQLERNRTLVETYNLLGDPATRLALPSDTLSVSATGSGGWSIASGNAEGEAQGLAELLDAEGNTLAQTQFTLRQGHAHVELAPSVEAASLRAYAWDQQRRWDALGRLDLLASQETLAKAGL